MIYIGIIFLFFDGFGIGDKSEYNPFYIKNLTNYEYIKKNCTFFETDATLGVDGLPQSATGQSTLFTGINTAKEIGRHLSAQPSPAIKSIIYKKNILKTLLKNGLKVSFSNVYTLNYLKKMMSDKYKFVKPSTTSLMSMSANLRFKQIYDLNEGMGMYHDITCKNLVDRGYDVCEITPERAARNLKNISIKNDFTLFEHFMCDIIGHKMDMELAISELDKVDKFIGELVNIINLKENMIIISSDHGNIEDLSIKTHTINKVPTIFISESSYVNNIKISSLVDIYENIISYYYFN